MRKSRDNMGSDGRPILVGRAVLPPGRSPSQQPQPQPQQQQQQQQQVEHAAEEDTLHSGPRAVQCCTVTRTDLGQEIFTCKFPGCGRVFTSRDAVRKHCRIRHLEWLRSIDPRQCVPWADDSHEVGKGEDEAAIVKPLLRLPPPVGAPLEGGAPVESDGVREANRERLLLAFVRNLQSKTVEAEPPAEKVAQIA